MIKELEVKNLTLSFYTNRGMVKAIRDISFTLNQGETLAIVGESGSGKSVTAKAILGLEAPNALIERGEILYKGEDLLSYTEEDFNRIRGNKITMIFQDPLSSLDPIMKIGKQMTEATLLNNHTNRKNARRAYKKRLKQLHSNTDDDELKKLSYQMNYKITKKMAYEKAIKIMQDVGITEPEKRFNQYPFEFSGGMRQRIVIAIAIAANPDLLICDEPTTALDVTIQAQIIELINKLKVKRNMSVIFITHDLGVVANVADRVAVMYAGKIVEVGTADDIFYRPAHPYTWALLSSMPDLDTKEKLEAIPGTPPNMIYPPQGDAFAERNKYAMQIDFEKQPPMFKISETHSAATWLLHPDAPKIDRPKAVTDRISRMTAKMESQENNNV